MRRFVVQRHRARRLHYDLRLEIDGVLVSWAVPRGPSLDAGVRRLAVHVDDHDLDYFDFEGVLPAGSYGAGDVIVWDWGTWSPGDGEDPAEAVRNGEIHLDMVGEKLAGRFVLIRTDGRGRGRAGVASQNAGREQWLLLHKRDEHALGRGAVPAIGQDRADERGAPSRTSGVAAGGRPGLRCSCRNVRVASSTDCSASSTSSA